MSWKGVIIEESLENKDLLKMVKIVNTKKSSLETEEGILSFHRIEVNVSKKDEFVSKAKSAIKNVWYMHICKSGKMIVIFKNKSFEFTKDDGNLEKARQYGLSIGIIRKRLGFEKLIENPYG